MLIFLAWQSKDPLKQQWPAATVARDLEGRMAPLVPEGLSAESWQGAAAGLAWLRANDQEGHERTR